jgi:beta-glucanase (GH16 family)
VNKFGIWIALATLCSGFYTSAIAQNSPAWNLVWSDEFNQADLTPPDPAKWGYDVGGTGWGNNELEYYTSRTNNARIEGGQLVIEARQESSGGRNYTSARLLTKGKLSWTYGRIEARIKLPRGQGIWPAFWMMGTNIDSVGWPTCGEVDIMENIGREPATVHGTIHGPGYSGANGIGGSAALTGGGAFADAFHVYGIEWSTNRIQWFVDGKPYFAAFKSSLPAGSQWVFNAPQFLLLNLAVGGDWPGNPDGTTTFPQRMLVDYVRVYAVTNALACGPNLLTNPGFESNTSTWSVYGAGFNTVIENVTNVPVHTGSNVFKVFGQFTGSENYSGMYQDHPATPGTSFTAGGRALTPSGDKIAGDNSAWLEVAFRDSTGANVGLYRSALITTNTLGGVWLNVSVTNQINPITFASIGSVTNLVAPAGTTAVRTQIVFRQPLSAAGSVLFDDVRLLSPGSARIPVATSANRIAKTLSLSFATYVDVPYQVRLKNDLTDVAWQVLTNVMGDGAIHLVTDSLGNSRRFYEVDCTCN